MCTRHGHVPESGGFPVQTRAPEKRLLRSAAHASCQTLLALCIFTQLISINRIEQYVCLPGRRISSSHRACVEHYIKLIPHWRLKLSYFQVPLQSCSHMLKLLRHVVISFLSLAQLASERRKVMLQHAAVFYLRPRNSFQTL